ncbi:MAG: lycopene cyclase [Polyangiaceae bacterium]
MSEAGALASLREAAGDELVERLLHLDRRMTEQQTERRSRELGPRPPTTHDALDCDVLVAGGGLWSVMAPLLAKQGKRIIVVDRARVGAAHREWNANRTELDALTNAGLLSERERDDLIVAEYERGFCQFHGGGPHTVRGVLDCAVDAARLLDLARRKGEAAGVTYVDGALVTGETASEAGVRVNLRERDRTREVTCKTMVDARGASSPYASFDLVCPTVGGVFRGFAEGSGEREVDPRVGEILVTEEGLDRGIQHVWELFPGREGEATAYLFYYAKRLEVGSLTQLYARLFAKLPSYKRGEAKLVRPTFGFIPGWSRLVPPPTSPHRNIVLVGDAAARHSPLTYCGFGSMLRSLAPLSKAIISGEAYEPHEPIHALTGILAHVLASRTLEGDALNELLDAAFATLSGLGQETYASMLTDTMKPKDFLRFLQLTARRYPSVWPTLVRAVGVRGGFHFSKVVMRAFATRAR